jgi:hypothetical protein
MFVKQFVETLVRMAPVSTFPVRMAVRRKPVTKTVALTSAMMAPERMVAAMMAPERMVTAMMVPERTVAVMACARKGIVRRVFVQPRFPFLFGLGFGVGRSLGRVMALMQFGFVDQNVFLGKWD